VASTRDHRPGELPAAGETGTEQVLELAISTVRLRKVFNGKVAVRGLTLDVRRGEVFGFLGPNGAGKSTSIKMLLGLIKPTSGTATLLGRSLSNRCTRAKIGFLPEHFRFYDWLTPAELLQLHGRLYGLTPEVLRQRIPLLLANVGLTPHRDKQLRRFSKGMLQRIGLAQALINEPDLIFLDEPTSGLDPVGRRLVRDIIHAERARGATVFLNSHLLSEVEVTCDRVAFIRAGEVLESGELGAFSRDRVSIFARARGLSKQLVAGLREWSQDVEWHGDQISLALDSDEAAPRILRYLVENGAEVFEFTPRRRSLEEKFLQLLGEDQGL
jgi:ABC-2 type transport system ATP-binding protein